MILAIIVSIFPATASLPAVVGDAIVSLSHYWNALNSILPMSDFFFIFVAGMTLNFSYFLIRGFLFLYSLIPIIGKKTV